MPLDLSFHRTLPQWLCLVVVVVENIGFMSLPGQRYSSMQCVGSSGSAQGFERSCLFHNVCLDPSANEWFFYRGKEKGQLFHLPEGPTYDFPERFLDLRSQSGGTDQMQYPWKPQSVYGPVPATARYLNVSLALMFTPLNMRNLGHALAENIQPLHLLKELFDLQQEMDTVVLSTQNCEDMYQSADNDTEHSQHLCRKFQHRFYPFVGRFKRHVRIPSDFGSDGLVCLKAVAMGIGRLTWNTMGWYSFRRSGLRRHGYDPDRQPTTQRIVILNKTGYRRIHNPEELATYLREEFGHSRWGGPRGLVVEVVDPLQMSFREEIETLMNTTVLITPVGGMSYASMFLPRSASAIYLDSYNTQTKTPFHNGPDHRFFSSMPFNDMYYQPMNESELVINQNCGPYFLSHPKKLMQYCMDVIVDFSRMKKLVYSGLRTWESMRN
jgi:hypothetical protein